MLALALPTTDVVARAAIVEGYNSNTYQAQDDPDVPLIKRHPSPFTGVDGSLELRWSGRDTDGASLLVGGRVQHYEPLQTENQSDDGGANARLSAQLTLGPRTQLTLADTASVTTFNAAHTTDGTLFAFDPTQQRSSYWDETLVLSIAHQLSPKWKLTQTFGGMVAGTIDSAPIVLPTGGDVKHRGLDYVEPYLETDLSKDFTWRGTGDLLVLYEYAYSLFVLDLTQRPPRNIGPDKSTFVTALAGYTYALDPERTVAVHGGLVGATAPPRDADPRPILSPSGTADFTYTRDVFNLGASVAYTWGTVNPRLGVGPTAIASVNAVGIPYHVGKWQNLALVGTMQASYQSLVTGANESTHLGLYSAGLEVRYGVNGWLGLLAGYDFRFATFSDPTSYEPPFIQNLVYLGLSGFWSTDRAQLPITTFASPIQPPA
ncbi:MAG TPA: hypothetical protein VH044_08900 [Polyangiaceae bacterium]|jgi:hypothetical protein|nr:hypothetical protein [Polyangiaceae bacterium]